MKESLSQKIVSITDPAAIVENAPFNTKTLDTFGFRQITIVVMLGALDVALAALKLRESDSADMSNALDVDGTDFSAAPNVLPSATDDNKAYAIHVDMRGRKRYLDLTMTGGNGATGTYATAFAILSRPETLPDTADKRGFAAELMV